MSTTTATSNTLPADRLVAEVDAWVRDFVAERGLPRNLADAVAYAALGPGKRVRPTLVVRACEAVGGALDTLTDTPGLLPGAAGLEMVHAFSLVHDDLPAMDDDDLRRGRPTLHRHTDEATAILAGDGLLSMAFEAIATRTADAGLAAALVGELATATTDMIAGQMFDTRPDFDEHMPAADRLSLVHRLKTAALLRAACRIGGRCGGADADQLAALTTYAEAVGLMFQVVDDLLDVTAEADHLGKATGKDEAAGKLTYPGLMGIDGTRAEVERLRAEANAAIEPLGESAAGLRRLADELAERRK
ncbi:MAG: polyprenyl synthetase family protein [Planctomycetota bacterium]